MCMISVSLAILCQLVWWLLKILNESNYRKTYAYTNLESICVGKNVIVKYLKFYEKFYFFFGSKFKMSQFEPLWVSSSRNQFCFMIISLKWGFVFKIIINLKPIFKSLIDQNEAKSSYQKKNGHRTNNRTFQENRTENRTGNRYLNYQNSRKRFFKNWKF